MFTTDLPDIITSEGESLSKTYTIKVEYKDSMNNIVQATAAANVKFFEHLEDMRAKFKVDFYE